MTSLGLDPERLTSLDQHGHRKAIIPAPVRGFFRRRRTALQGVLIVFFLLLPWVQIGGEQAILINLFQGRFAIFGLQLFAHDTPLIFLVLASAAFALLWTTAVWGRIWCGWACPQTVFIDGVFRRIEEWIEGSYLQRRQMRDSEEKSLGQWLRFCVKWFLFFIISSVLAHSLIALFAGSKALLAMMTQAPSENWSYFSLVSVITALILFDFGWFREQFCIIMCPYGRFQSVLMDSTSLAIIYDEKRGEPRKGSALAKSQGAGDCVACSRCVQVCPTGIDIRKGVQMECIACTGCIDACDEIMEKVHKPKGLIRYGNVRGGSWRMKKPRAIIYFALMFASLAGLSYAVGTREEIHWTILRGQGPVFREVHQQDGSTDYSNHLRLHIQNQTASAIHRSIRASTRGEALTISSAENPFVIQPGELKTVHLFVTFRADQMNAKGEVPVDLSLADEISGMRSEAKTYKLVGPNNVP